jgi:hypothetical protein
MLGSASPNRWTRCAQTILCIRLHLTPQQVADIYSRSHTIRSACDILHTHVIDPGLEGPDLEDCRFFLRNMLRYAVPPLPFAKAVFPTHSAGASFCTGFACIMWAASARPVKMGGRSW